MTASSRRYAEVIGDPIAHSKSPAMHNFWLEQLGIDAEYGATHVRPEELRDYVRRKGQDPDWLGTNLTIPHKIDVMTLVQRIEPPARDVGAANCLYRDRAGELTATNSDVDGIADAIGSHLDAAMEPVVIGSGGAARAAFHVLEKTGCRRVRILSRDPERAIALASAFSFQATGIALADAGDALLDAELLINASPMGMAGKAPMPAELLEAVPLMAPGAMLFDMVYAPLETELLHVGRAAGLEGVDGLTMLIGQAATAFALFFGQPAPRQHDAELRQLLQA